jgi:protein NrfD
VTLVFFLFLEHLGLGVLAMLPFVPERAGRSYFKFCSAAAAFTMAAALGLVLRRYGLPAGKPDAGAPGGIAYSAFVVAAAMSLLFVVLYNRAWHFSWRAIRPFLLAASLAAGLATVVLGAPPTDRPLSVLTDLTSILLLGAAASAMVLGHWYLVVLDLPITALRRLTVVLALALVLRAAVVALALAGPVHAGFADARAVAEGLWSPDGVFVWMRLLFGLAGPLSLLWFVWKTVEIRSTQSATGILYVQLFLVLAGELLAKYLRVAAGFPL